MNAIIYGTGKFAEYVSFLLVNDSEYNVSGFCIEKKYMDDRNMIEKLPVFDFENIECLFPPNKFQMFIAIGLNKERDRVFQLAKHKGYRMLSYISSKSITWNDLTYGENTWISEDTAIQPFVTIGTNSVIFGGKIAHHSKIGNNCLLSGATVGGNVSIGDFSMLGINSSIKQNVIIGKNNIVGMGCIIEKNTKENEIYYAGDSTNLRNVTTDRIDNKYLR